MTDITTIIVAKGSPEHLNETVASVKDLSDEIIIVDIGLAPDFLKNLDKTVKVHRWKTEVVYVEQIREETKKLAKTEYILFLDPDEIVPDGLKKIILQEYTAYDFLKIPRKNIIFGKWIENSRWWPDYQIRLFKKNKVSWPVKIHSQPVTEGNGLEIIVQEENALVHYNYKNIREYFEKMIRYAQSEADEHVQHKKDLTLHEALTKSIQEFISRFFAEKGYRDGMHGLALSFLQMMYPFIVFLFYWEEKKYFEISEIELKKETGYFFKQGLYETNHWNEMGGIKNKIVNRLLK